MPRFSSCHGTRNLMPFGTLIRPWPQRCTHQDLVSTMQVPFTPSFNHMVGLVPPCTMVIVSGHHTLPMSQIIRLPTNVGTMCLKILLAVCTHRQHMTTQRCDTLLPLPPHHHIRPLTFTFLAFCQMMVTISPTTTVHCIPPWGMHWTMLKATMMS